MKLKIRIYIGLEGLGLLKIEGPILQVPTMRATVCSNVCWGLLLAESP